MEVIKIELAFFEDCIFNSPLPHEIDLVSKNRQFQLGYLCLELREDFSIPSSFKQCTVPTTNGSEKAPKKRISDSRMNHSGPKPGKIAPKVQKQQTLPPNVLSPTVAQPNIDSFISINQNLTTGEKVFQCNSCGLSTPLRTSIKRHVENKHMTSSKVFRCRTCNDVTFNVKSNLKRHYMTKHDMPEPAAAGMLMC